MNLFQMIIIDMGISEGVDKFPGLQATYLGNHQGKEGIGGDIKGNAQKYVRTALVELA